MVRAPSQLYVEPEAGMSPYPSVSCQWSELIRLLLGAIVLCLRQVPTAVAC